MTRRTLALAGAAVLTLGMGGLAGPASADSGAGITQQEGIFINEVAAELNTTFNGGLIVGGFVELINDNPSGVVDVGGWTVIACTPSNSFMVIIDGGTTIPAGEKFLVGDPTYDALSGPTPDQSFGDALEQDAGGVLLVNNDPTPEVQDQLRWEDPVSLCDSFTDVGASPTDTQSVNRGSPVLRSPTPEALN